ncbi:zinc-binding protein [Enterovibrio norvegicus FF-454]|uniref:Zinc-binding protein n=1 Tax=Enterovibrio norvegicus FF-454 TaxID=1185651 RepID=A0A1E5BW44_9GAMM|nr:DUF2796 domain-containing protein [Enterovibrio norvegicus]OEE57478.1 zinc-binding protein [Enterovibrio norvegicus FF-454]
MRNTTRFTLSAIALGMATFAVAESNDFTQHSAHQHGLVEWHIAQDGEELLVEITAPGSDIVGFEYAPQNEEQKAAIEQALKSLAKADTLIELNASANCELVEQSVTQTLDESDDHSDHDDHDAHDKHDDHDNHDKHDGHDNHDNHDGHDAHDKHDGHDAHDKHGGHDAHDKHDDHSEHHQKDAESHGEFSAQYTFHCSNPTELQSVTSRWFDTFGQTEKISVQAITDKGVSAGELTPTSRTIRF